MNTFRQFVVAEAAEVAAILLLRNGGGTNLDNGIAQQTGTPCNEGEKTWLSLHPMRLQEVLGLLWQDIDLDNNLIHINNTLTHPDRNQGKFKKKTKTDLSRRIINMVPQIKKYLQVGDAKDFVIGGKVIQSYQNVQDMCERIQKDTNFDESITPIRFRTTVLTDIYDQTKDIKQTQDVAGHTTAVMTLKHYVKGRKLNRDTATPIANLYGLM